LDDADDDDDALGKSVVDVLQKTARIHLELFLSAPLTATGNQQNTIHRRTFAS
jgi:hypothetical protein